MTLILTYDLDPQSSASYGHDLLTCKSLQGQRSVRSEDKAKWKQSDGQTDGSDCITSLANAAGKNAARHYCSPRAIASCPEFTKYVMLAWLATEM